VLGSVFVLINLKVRETADDVKVQVTAPEVTEKKRQRKSCREEQHGHRTTV